MTPADLLAALIEVARSHQTERHGCMCRVFTPESVARGLEAMRKVCPCPAHGSEAASPTVSMTVRFGEVSVDCAACWSLMLAAFLRAAKGAWGMDDHDKGLYDKFVVTRTDGGSASGEKHDGCRYFVLDLTHDPFAMPALRAYAMKCRSARPELALDLWLLAEREPDV